VFNEKAMLDWIFEEIAKEETYIERGKY